MLDWKDIGVANFPGVISLSAGLLMWVTSLQPVRKQFFELFFYTHQLYVIFVVFLALHVGDFIFSMCAGAVFLFILDRFLRFCQSRTKVDVISAACRPCGTIELILSKPPSNNSCSSSIYCQLPTLSEFSSLTFPKKLSFTKENLSMILIMLNWRFYMYILQNLFTLIPL